MLVPSLAFVITDYVDPNPAKISLSDITTGIQSGDPAWELFIDGVSSDTGTGHEYEVFFSAGLEYTVKMTVTDTEGSYTTSRIFLIPDGEHFYIYQSINDMILISLGSSVNWNLVSILKAKYQSLFYDALKSQFKGTGWEVSENPTYDERYWPQLANLLISYLIIRDLITNSLNASMAAGGGGGETTVLAGGEVTRIITGPTEVQFAPPSVTLSQAFKEGFYDLIQQQLCALSSRLGVYVAGCEVPTILPRRYSTDYTGYPAWEIVSADEVVSQA